jgi:hypothetical protein
MESSLLADGIELAICPAHWETEPMVRLCVGLLTFACLLRADQLEWPQWGGPHGNFKSDAKGLANSWPAAGPKKLWSRPLGDGYSAISVDGNVLYTMYRTGHDEIVLAADARSGKTIWEHRYDATFQPGMGMENGPGPYATPLVTDAGVYAIGILGNLVCLNKKTGNLVWSHDLYKEYDGTFFNRGYSPSPVAYRNAVIMKVGGAGHALIAFDQKTGKEVWRTRQKFDNAPATPLLVQVDGQDHLITMMSDEVVAVDPSNGRLLWTSPHRTMYGLNITTPVWGDDKVVFVTSAYPAEAAPFSFPARMDACRPKNSGPATACECIFLLRSVSAIMSMARAATSDPRP